MITQERLKEVLAYEPSTGVFTWRIGRPKAAAGAVAGGKNWKGYCVICVDGKRYRAHRLAWLYVHGAMPESQIDHINHDKLDNRIENLRVVTNLENHKNMGLFSDNTSGYTGVSFCKAKQKWTARIKDGKVYRNLGYFADKLDAVAARETKKIELGYHPNHGLPKEA